MSPSEAARILREYNAYRKGSAPYPEVTAKKVGEAIDFAVAFLFAAEPSDTRHFRFGSVTYDVYPLEKGYKIVRNGWQVAYTDDSFIYDYCDTDSYVALKHNEEYKQKYFKAKHMAVALFKKQKKG